MKIHIVQKGDTLWKVAKKYGVNFEQLKKMNSQLSNPDMLMPGMKIKIPEGTAHPIKNNTNTKVKFGSVKEAPVTPAPITTVQPESSLQKPKEAPIQPQAMPVQPKEMPIQPPVMPIQPKEMPIQQVIPTPPPMPVKKEMPIQPMEKKKAAPMKVKEMPKMPYVAPIASVQPVMPEIDINNYYMMNMAKMNVQVPQPAPIKKEAPKMKEKPKEKPKKQKMKKEKPMPLPMPIEEEYCPPMMPHHDHCYMPFMHFDPCCPPMMPHFDPCCHPFMMHPHMMMHPHWHQPEYQMGYPAPYMDHGFHMEESSSFHYEPESSSSHSMMGYPSHQGYPMAHPYHTGHHYPAYPQPMMPAYGPSMPKWQSGHQPAMQGYHHMGGHHGMESSSGYGMESSSHHHMAHTQHMSHDGYVPQCGFTGGGYQGQMPQMQQMPAETYYQPMTMMGGGQPHMGQHRQEPSQELNYGTQDYMTDAPSYNQAASQMMPRVDPAAFDMPSTQDESSENEGQS